VLEHIAGYCCFNDGSVRDWQKQSVTAGKNFHRSGAFGPVIVTPDEVGDPDALTLVTRVNGMEVQRASTGTMIYDIRRVISYISTFVQLTPGDVIATGTPSGVGARRDPPLWLKPGDRVEVEIERVGVLCNPVVAE
jgi:2-keto-4-pentenoate hydratase/2-oxohepta-3-ene-1,7-dioic acid hydratase in catechol pathway